MMSQQQEAWGAVLALQETIGKAYDVLSFWNYAFLEGIPDKEKPEKELKLKAFFPDKNS